MACNGDFRVSVADVSASHVGASFCSPGCSWEDSKRTGRRENRAPSAHKVPSTCYKPRNSGGDSKCGGRVRTEMEATIYDQTHKTGKALRCSESSLMAIRGELRSGWNRDSGTGKLNSDGLITPLSLTAVSSGLESPHLPLRSPS